MEKLVAIFSKNCVLMGDIDSYCLVCSIPLTGDVLEHIRCPEHDTKLKQTVYFEKYKDDFIKKVNGVYFCEVCHKTFFTATNVGIHVTEKTHIKGIRGQLTRVGTSVVFQKDTPIEERAWNGLVEDTCVVCNVDIDDHSTHMSEHSHTLNVVRSTVTIDDDNNIYRKVEGGYQCLTCNKVVSNTEICKHLDSEQHKVARVSLGCTRNDADINQPNIDQINEEKKEQTTENEAHGDDTQATSSKNVDTEVLSDNSSVTEGKAIKKPTAVSIELETYANKHGLIVTQDRFSLNCQVCGTIVPGTMNNLHEHKAGKRHKENMKLQAQAERELNMMRIEKESSKQYFTRTLIVDYRSERYVIINDSFCIEFRHFVCLLDMGTIVICHPCETEISQEDRAMHFNSPSHKFKLRNASVVTSLKGEFIRQIESLYHCGFCGVFQKEFGSILDHLNTALHEHQKDTKKKILQRIKDEGLLNHHSTKEINIFERFLALSEY